MNKIKKFSVLIPLAFYSLLGRAYAGTGQSVVNTTQVSTVANNIKDAISKIAMPIGSVLILGSVIMVAIKMIVNHFNPTKRSESIVGLFWIAGGALVLGLALMISGLVIGVATNGSGVMH